MSDRILVVLAKSIADLRDRVTALAREPGPSGKDGAPGATGPTGNNGEPGPAGPEGRAGVAGAAGRPGRDGKDGRPGATGPTGPDGKDGEPGPMGPMPKHEWRGTKLRFQKAPDQWGKWVDLQGPSTSSSLAVIQDPEGNELKPEKLPLVETVVMGDQMVMVRDGAFVRVKIVLSGIPTNAVTVNGTPVTVNGEYVVLAE